jgi:polyisoprenyl-phosphate glycosyltransferase
MLMISSIPTSDSSVQAMASDIGSARHEGQIAPMAMNTATNTDLTRGSREPSHILVITPILDDWTSFAHLVGELGKVGTEANLRFTVLAIDDGSSQPAPALDHSSWSEGIAEVRLIHLVRNMGHQRAIAVGLVEAYRQFDRESYAAVVVMDSDGEDPPQDIPALVRALVNAPEGIAVATRRKRQATLLFRAGYGIYKFLYRTLCNHTLDFGNFCAISPAALEQLVHASEIWNHLAATISRLRCKIVRVPHDRGRRYAGTAKMTWQSLVMLGMSSLSVYTDVILIRIMFGTLAFAAVTGIVILTLLFLYLFTDWPIRGWTSILAGVLFAILVQVLIACVGASFLLLSNRSSIARIPVHELPIFVRARREL